MLARRVSQPLAHGHHAAHGGQIDHAPALPLQHRRHKRPTEIKRTAHVDRVQAVEVRRRRAQQIAHVADPGVVHQYIERRQPRRERHRRRLVAHIERGKLRHPSRRANRRDDLDPVHFIAVHHPHGRALPRKRLRDGPTDSGCSASDERVFACELKHGENEQRLIFRSGGSCRNREPDRSHNPRPLASPSSSQTLHPSRPTALHTGTSTGGTMTGRNVPLSTQSPSTFSIFATRGSPLSPCCNRLSFPSRRAHFPSRAHAFICAIFCSVTVDPDAFAFRFPSPT